jgi:hypothetical protein
MLVLAHATPLYRGAGYVERTHYYLSRSTVPLVVLVLLTYGPPHTVAKFPGVHARPSSLSPQPASRRAECAHHLFAHMRSHMSVKTQHDPLNLHIFHLDVLVMKNKSNKDLRWLLLELLKSKILFIV